MIRSIVMSLFFALLSLPLMANDVELKPGYPQHYVVKKGDTLWDISSMYLKYPWHWPDIWYLNPQIENPHLIYPGDELSLVWRDGSPMIELNRGQRTVKLSPEVREIELDKPIPTISPSEISPFLAKPKIVGAEVLDQAPYVVAGAEDRFISSAGDYVYVRGLRDWNVKEYSIFQAGKEYIDPETNEVLGYEALYLGDASLVTPGDPAKLNLINTSREVKNGSRLLKLEENNYNFNFIPRSPAKEMNGKIISFLGGLFVVGQYQTVVINLGSRDGLEVGHVLSIYRDGDTIRDTVDKSHDMVTLPDEHAGEVMVFKIYEKLSYAIVMEAARDIHLLYKVKSAPGG